jgi:signal transduction histidine kinase
VARELHDGIGQALTGIKFTLENGLRRLRETGDPDPSSLKVLENIIPLIQATVDETRHIAMGLRPSTLDDIGITETIYWFCQQFEKIYQKIRILKSVDIDEDQISATLKTVIFRVMQESLNNVAKHSGADRIRVSLQQEGDTIRLLVQDNGSGFEITNPSPPDSSSGGFGLAGMRERTELSGGTFNIETSRGQGTIICAVWPITEESSICLPDPLSKQNG